MNKKNSNCIIMGIILVFLSFSMGYGQGDNTPDPMVNLGVLPSAILTGSVPADSGRGIPSDILWDPATNDYATPSTWHEYGLGYQETMGGVTKDNPFYWQVEWPSAKNINYITCTGPFGNQPQPHTGWAIQIDSAGTWRDLAKAHNGWDADSLRGIGGWVNDGLLEWRGMEPVVTTKLRFIAFANPDSLADGVETFADSLWSFVFVGRKLSASAPNSCLIQYLDFTGEAADNRVDDAVNLGLIHEAVVSGSYVAGEIQNLRGEPADMLFDPVKGDFNNTNTPWGEFGMPYQYDGGFVTEDDPFYWMVEWPVPKMINYFTWGGVYGNQPQPTTPWAVQYWDGAAWVTLEDGVGGSLAEGVNGVDVDAQSTWQTDTPVETTKFRFAVWSDGIDPLWSFHFRGRGGSTMNWDERDSTFKAILLQYRDLTTVSVESDDLVKPTEFSLHQNYPNPFNPETKIGYQLPKAVPVQIKIFDVLGREVRTLIDSEKEAGFHIVKWDARDNSGLKVSSGVYFYQIVSGEFKQTKKLLLMK